MPPRHLALTAALLMLAATPVLADVKPAETTTAASAALDPVVADLQAMIDHYRKGIVLLADVETLDDATRRQAIGKGQALFHSIHAQQEQIAGKLHVLAISTTLDHLQRIATVLDYIELDDKLYDGDQLAFREPLLTLQAALVQDANPLTHTLHRRIARDLHAMDGIEHEYNSEFEKLFSRVQNHTEKAQRNKWDEYVTHLQAIYPRDDILKEFGVAQPMVVTPVPGEKEAHIFGDKFPPKTIALTFDDGPHPKYTAQIVAILQHYHVPGTFFEIGQNIGTIDAQGKPVLNRNADITRMLLADGYHVGNHSYTHPIMSKESGPVLLAEINNTDLLLKAIDPNRDPLFRFPYGAHNPEAMGILAEDHLQSVLWNVDSLDWADPVPNSVADRVLREVDKAGHGIILFHDIHDRAVKALPTILDHLMAEGYHFAGWDGKEFTVPAQAQGPGKH